MNRFALALWLSLAPVAALAQGSDLSNPQTNASALTSGTVAAARGGAGTTNGALKGNGSGAVSQAASTDLSDTTAATTWTAADASGASLTFSSVTGSFSKGNKTCVGGFRLTYPSTANGSTAQVTLPCTGAVGFTGTIGMCWTNITGSNNLLVLNVSANTATAFFQNNASPSANPTNANLTTAVVSCSFSFITT